MVSTIELAGDQVFHDLGGTAVDALRPRIGVQARDRIFDHAALGAGQLRTSLADLALLLGAPSLDLQAASSSSVPSMRFRTGK